MSDKAVLVKMKISSFVPAALALLMAAGVLTVFSACPVKEDGTWMRCHGAQMAVAACGAAMAALFAISAFVKAGRVKILLNAAAFALSAAAFLLPGNIMPMCLMRTMRCYAVMQPFVRIMSVLTAVSALWGAAGAFRAETRKAV